MRRLVTLCCFGSLASSTAAAGHSGAGAALGDPRPDQRAGGQGSVQRGPLRARHQGMPVPDPLSHLPTDAASFMPLLHRFPCRVSSRARAAGWTCRLDMWEQAAEPFQLCCCVNVVADRCHVKSMQVKDQLNKKLAERGIIIEEVLLRSVTLPVRFYRHPGGILLKWGWC